MLVRSQALRPLGVHIGSSCKARVQHPRQRRIFRRRKSPLSSANSTAQEPPGTDDASVSVVLEYCPEARMVIHNACMPQDEE